MDVTCERCGTEYEFDETLVSDRGTTVKCTHCGHLFKVFRPGASDGPKTWTVRTRAGKVQNLTSLRDLQRLITQGELKRDDEISRSGESWKKLGDIAELVTFFSAAEAGNEKPKRRDGTQPFTTGPAASTTPFSRSPSARPNAVPEAPSRGHGSGPLQRPPSAPPPKHATPPVPAIPPSDRSAGLGMEDTAPLRSTQPEEQRITDPRVAGAGRVPLKKPPAKRTIMGVGASSPAADATIVDSQANARAEASTGFDEQPTEVDQGPATGRTADRSVGRLEGLGGPDAPVLGEVPKTRSMPKMEVPEEEAEPRQKSTTRQGYSDPGEPAQTAGARPKSRGAPTPQKQKMYVDEDAEVAAIRAQTAVKPKSSRTGFYVALVLLLTVGIGAGLFWNRLAPLLGLAEPPDRVAEFVERGEAALALDHQDAYHEAIRELTRATAIDERDLRVLSGLSRAHAALAQELAFKTADLVARAGADPTLSGEAAALRRESEENASEARRYGEDAVRIDPNHVVSVLALADALRLTGDGRGARSHLDRARTLEPEASPQQLYVVALFELDSPEGNPGPALEAARRAATAAPGLLRARLLLARALLATGDVAGARAEVNAVLAAVPDHPVASYLAQAMDRGLPPAAPIVESLDGGADAGVDAAGAIVAETETETEAETESGSSHGGGESSAPPRGRDYSYYIERGDELMERGDVGRARGMYEAALEVRPGASEAQNGLGYVMLETGNPRGAVSNFRAASNAGFAGAFIGLGDAYRQMGQNAQALEAYRGYLERLPNGPAAYTARRQIEMLAGSESGGGTESGGGGDEGSGTEGGGGGGDEGGGTETTTEPTPAPETAPDELPAPRGATEADLPPPDQPAVGSE